MWTAWWGCLSCDPHNLQLISITIVNDISSSAAQSDTLFMSPERFIPQRMCFLWTKTILSIHHKLPIFPLHNNTGSLRQQWISCACSFYSNHGWLSAIFTPFRRLWQLCQYFIKPPSTIFAQSRTVSKLNKLKYLGKMFRILYFYFRKYWFTREFWCRDKGRAKADQTWLDQTWIWGN